MTAFSASRARLLVGYVAMIAGSVGIYLLVRHSGAALLAPPAPETATEVTPSASHSYLLAHLLLALAGIMVTARFVGLAFERWLKQPRVIGEIVAGLMLGPSVLGAISPVALAFVLPADVAPHLGMLAKVGVVLFMFLVGLELDPGLLKGKTHATLSISHASILAPFLLGAALALWVYPLYSNESVGFTVFSLFLGVSMSVTAFPVLARILTDKRIQRTPLGVTALTCAAVDDATAWCMLALVSGVATAQVGDAGRTVLLAAAFVAFVFFVVRPLVRRLADSLEAKPEGPSLDVLALVLGAMLLCAVATDAIGIHALFGAFLFGAVVPHDGRLAEHLRHRLEDVVVVLFLPIFFAFTGMRTRIGLVSGWQDWAVCAAIIAVATAGKFGGSFVAARLAGLGRLESAALGILMNTRGLMELIVLNVGLDMGVISPTVFAMLVIMALVTTFATSPALALVLGRRGWVDVPEGRRGGVVSPP